MVKQISVFVENKKGRLAKITDVLGQGGIDLIALSIADTTNFGIMRCIVNDPDKAILLLKQNGFTASTTEVIVAEVIDKPGGLATVLRVLDSAGISVEYLYSFVRTPNENALILFRVEDIETAVKALKANGIRLIEESDVIQI
ncbi:MAG: ACT domain-containing protein [Christensenellales bacterium]|jgi:hypothetical protein